MLTHLMYALPVVVTVSITWWALGLKEENKALKAKLSDRR